MEQKFTVQGSSSSYGSFFSGRSDSNNVGRSEDKNYSSQGSSSQLSYQPQSTTYSPQYTQEQLEYRNRKQNQNIVCQNNTSVTSSSQPRNEVKYSLQGSSHPNENVKAPTNLHNTKKYHNRHNRMEQTVHSVQLVLSHVPGGELVVGGIETGEVLLDQHKSVKEKTAEIGGIGVKTVVSIAPVHPSKVIGMAAGKVVERTIKNM